MSTCPDCITIEEQAKGNNQYKLIDIGEHVKNLKTFLKLRDNNAIFDDIKKSGSIGIPCFVLENGSITFIPEEAGFNSNIATIDNNSCNIDGSGC